MSDPVGLEYLELHAVHINVPRGTLWTIEQAAAAVGSTVEDLMMVAAAEVALKLLVPLDRSDPDGEPDPELVTRYRALTESAASIPDDLEKLAAGRGMGPLLPEGLQKHAKPGDD